MTTTTTTEEWISFAKVGKPHGLKGAFFLVANDRRKELIPYSKLKITQGNTTFETKVLRCYLSGNHPVVLVDKITSAEEAERFVHAEVMVSREELVEDLNANEFLVTDLIGLNVTQNGILIGKVVAVHDFGAQENLEIQLEGSSATFYFPLLEQFVEDINFESSTIKVNEIDQFK